MVVLPPLVHLHFPDGRDVRGRGAGRCQSLLQPRRRRILTGRLNHES